MSLREIDVAVAECIRSGGSLYTVDEQLLNRLAPTHILTQALCEVCAPSGNQITSALNALAAKPEVLWFTPRCLADIDENLRQLGRATGRLDKAEEIIASGHRRLEAVAALTRSALPRPRVLCLEWADPYYCCGHWVPEMVEIAGGQDALGRKGTDSVRIAWSDIAAWSPEVLIVMPCGFGLDKAVEQTRQLLQQPGWSDLPAVRQERVFAVNANSYFARPGPRVIEGTELLAHLLHPELCEWNGSDDAFRKIPCGTIKQAGTRTKQCSECGASFTCGAEAGNGTCWCDELPPLSPVSPDRDCLCPQCLGQAIGATGG
jgi:iron complex transport system substrate-binding protein